MTLKLPPIIWILAILFFLTVTIISTAGITSQIAYTQGYGDGMKAQYTYLFNHHQLTTKGIQCIEILNLTCITEK